MPQNQELNPFSLTPQPGLAAQLDSPVLMEEVRRKAVRPQARRFSAQLGSSDRRPGAGHVGMCIPPRAPSVPLHILEENSHSQTKGALVSQG